MKNLVCTKSKIKSHIKLQNPQLDNIYNFYNNDKNKFKKSDFLNNDKSIFQELKLY